MRLFSYLSALGAAAAQNECGSPPALENGSVEQNGNEATYSCDLNFCFDGERTRNLKTSCQNGLWEKVSECVPCAKCTLPNVGGDMNVEWIDGTFDAKLSCFDGVIEPGTQETELTISCIQGEQWNRDIPVCSKPSIITCADDYMEAVIDKNMLKAKGWAGDASNIFLDGQGMNLISMDDISDECFATEDENGNYKLRIEAPFMGKCGTASTINGQDYVFANKVNWRKESAMSVKEANLLDFQCVYQGVFMAGLPHKVKLAINTKQYFDDDSNQPFTVSMSVYDRANFTGLVDNIPILHRGKRYYVDLHMHNSDLGTPYLKHCYGSNNFVSEQELKEKYRMTTSSSSIRTMVVNGCPAPKTLVKLEESPNTYQTRFSFMFPKVGHGIADLQFVYLHCEIEMKPIGYAPVCDDNLYRQVLQRNFKEANKFPGKGLGFLSNENRNINARGGFGEKSNMKKEVIMEIRCKLPWMATREECAPYLRNRRAAPSQDMSVGFGPLVVPEEESLANEHPSSEELSQLLDGSDIFVEEVEEIVTVVRDDVTGEETAEIEQIEIIRNQRKNRKTVIISCMAAGCVLLFFLSVCISSRVSCACYKDSRKNSSKKISTDVLASQIQKELSNPSQI